MSECAALEQIWEWLDAVPDPEIPVISVVDLGIVRSVEWRGAHDAAELVVGITPTYSGCPATAVIRADIEAALRARGVERLRIEERLSPPWTTDWLSDKGKEQLIAFGIAPPVGEAACGAPSIPPAVACPRCGSERTVVLSPFGSTPCKAQLRCESCLEPFDYFKCL